MFNRNVVATSCMYVVNQRLMPITSISIFGVTLILVITNQLYSGIICALYTLNDALLLVTARDEVDMEELYSDDIFHIHERGVDLTFIFLYCHFMRKFFLKSYHLLQITAWKTGSILFLLIHGIIFFGLVLCCTHLSDITLKIAANILQTLFFKYGNISYILFTDHTINTDTLIRMMYLHYILALSVWGIIILHLVNMHYGHKNNIFFKALYQLFNWFGEIFKFEFTSTIIFITFLIFFYICYYKYNEALSYEIFMWGDIGLISDVRFLGVAPHWYFKPYMSWLIFCPHHYIGIFGLVIFFIGVYFQPNIFNFFFKLYRLIKLCLNYMRSRISYIIFSLFFGCCMYTISYLPCGKYFTYVYGNQATTISFMYIFLIWFINIDVMFKQSIWVCFYITHIIFIKAVRIHWKLARIERIKARMLYEWFFSHAR